jgi:hypothetical protein
MVGAIYVGERPGLGPLAQRRIDPCPALDWGRREPAPRVPRNRFSGSWKGVVVVPRSGQYYFRVRHRGGATLTIGGRTLINEHSMSEGWAGSSTRLRAGPTQLLLTYAEKRENKDSEVRVYWSGPDFGCVPLGPVWVGHSSYRLKMAKAWEEPELDEREAAGPALPPALRRKVAERPPEGNIVENAGFEDITEQTKFPKRWAPHQWGERGVQSTVRADRSNPRSGERAMVVRGFAAGGRPGFFQTMTLPPGRYEVRYWACADIGKAAQVQAHLAGHDLGVNSVGEEYRQFTDTVDLEEKAVNASLRIWTPTPRVRVWFDDVEVEAPR